MSAEHIRLIKITNPSVQSFSNVRKFPGELRDYCDHEANQTFLDRQAETESNARSYPRKLPFALAKAKGIFVQDVDGNLYYDCLSGAGSIALGHNHPTLHQAISDLMASDAPILTLDITTPVKSGFVEEVLKCLPSEFSKKAKIQFCAPSGSDAVEAAMKLVKIATGRPSMMSFRGGYHGMTAGALGLMGHLGSKSRIPGFAQHVQFLPYPSVFRSPVGDALDTEGKATIRYIENLLLDEESGVPKPAGIIIEAVQGEGGKFVAPARWMKELRRITQEHDIPLILDEVQTGFGRTGKMFAFEHSGIIPDVIIMSKAIGGSLPLAIVAYHERLDVWEPGVHAGTFRGNQMAMAAGTETIKFIKQHGLVDQVAVLGQRLMQNLKSLQKEHPCIGDVRGLGFMIGVEIVNAEGPLVSGYFPHDKKIASAIQKACFLRGLVLETGGRQSSVLRFMPPLIATEEDIDNIFYIFRDALISVVS